MELISFWEYLIEAKKAKAIDSAEEDDEEVLGTKPKKLTNKKEHLRYFGTEAQKEIIGTASSKPELGRGRLLDTNASRVTRDHFKTTAFRHKSATGARLIPTTAKPRVVNRKITKEFFSLSPESGITKQEIPISQVILNETKDTGKHNDEHSITRLWNYFSHKKNGHRQKILSIINGAKPGEDVHDKLAQYLLDEVEKSTSDLNHPLSIAASNEREEFMHGSHGFTFTPNRNEKITATNNPDYSDETRKRALESHTTNMRNGALSLARMLLSEREKRLFDGDYEMIGTGRELGKLNDNAKFFGMKDGSASAMSKADVKLFHKRGDPVGRGIKIFRDEGVSVKKGGGSQLESPDAKGFNVLFSYAIENASRMAKEAHPKNAKEIEEIRKQAHDIRRTLGGFEGTDETELEKTKNALRKIGVDPENLLPPDQKSSVAQGGLMHRKADDSTEGFNPDGIKGAKLKFQHVAHGRLQKLYDLFESRPDLFGRRSEENPTGIIPNKDGRSDFGSWITGASVKGDHKIKGDIGTAKSILIHGIYKQSGKHKRADFMDTPEFVESLRDPKTGLHVRGEINKGKHGGLCGLRIRHKGSHKVPAPAVPNLPLITMSQIDMPKTPKEKVATKSFSQSKSETQTVSGPTPESLEGTSTDAIPHLYSVADAGHNRNSQKWEAQLQKEEFRLTDFMTYMQQKSRR